MKLDCSQNLSQCTCMFQAVMSVLFDLQARDGIVPEALCHDGPEVLKSNRSQNLCQCACMFQAVMSDISDIASLSWHSA